jgi:hypothetical protein
MGPGCNLADIEEGYSLELGCSWVDIGEDCSLVGKLEENSTVGSRWADTRDDRKGTYHSVVFQSQSPKVRVLIQRLHKRKMPRPSHRRLEKSHKS